MLSSLPGLDILLRDGGEFLELPRTGYLGRAAVPRRFIRQTHAP